MTGQAKQDRPRFPLFPGGNGFIDGAFDRMGGFGRRQDSFRLGEQNGRLEDIRLIVGPGFNVSVVIEALTSGESP